MAERSIGREVYNSLVPSNVRILAETAMGSTAPITEQDLTPADLAFLRRQYEETRGRNVAAESELVKRLGSSEAEYMKNPLVGKMQISSEGVPSQSTVPYADVQKKLQSYQTTRDRTSVGYSPRGSGVDTVPVGQAISRTLTDPEFRMSTLLGRYQVVETPEGPVAVDRYNFNRMNTESSETLSASDLINAPVQFLDTAMRKYLPSASRPVNIRLGIPANQSYQQGGLVTQEGPQMAMQTPQPMDTTSLDLPPALESLLNMGAIQAPMQPPSAGLSSALSTTAMTPMGSSQPMPSYQEGGMVGAGGAPIRPDLPSPAPAGGQPGLAPSAGGLSPQQIQMEAQRFVQRNPRQVQEIQMAIQQAMQSGELTQQELNTLVQMATVALQNPDMYPQLRNVAIQQGLATPQDISQQFDPGLLFTLIVVGQAMSSQGGAPQSQGQMGQPVAENPALMPAATQTGGVSSAEVGPMPSMAKGGELPAKSEPVPIMAHTGEYVIPAAVVRAKGTEFFDSLVAKYRGDRE
jgi:hypothetical protein